MAHPSPELRPDYGQDQLTLQSDHGPSIMQLPVPMSVPVLEQLIHMPGTSRHTLAAPYGS